jgi:hypothetical protein
MPPPPVRHAPAPAAAHRANMSMVDRLAQMGRQQPMPQRPSFYDRTPVAAAANPSAPQSPLNNDILKNALYNLELIC